MAHKAVIAALILACLFQTVLSMGALTPAAAFRANMQQRQRSPNTLFFVEEPAPLRQFDDIKEPIMKRFKPCYYSPIQCLIKK